MTRREYNKMADLISALAALFISADMIFMIIGMIVMGVKGLPKPEPIFMGIMTALMFVHVIAYVIYGKMFEREYGKNLRYTD